jgi:excisionase family DNA binding protein
MHAAVLMHPAEMLTTEDVAARLNCSIALVYLLVRRGELRACRVGKLLRFRADVLDAYVAAGGSARQT